jgi:hypothetical protein
MLGLYLVLIGIVWLGIVVALATWLTLRIKTGPMRVFVALALVAVLLPMPLIDEIVGRHQFEQLCREHNTIHIDRTKAVGKTVYLVQRPPVDAEGTWVRIVIRPFVYVDAETGDPVVSYNELTAVGSRFLPSLSQGRMPLLFNGFCAPPNRPATAEAFEAYGIKYIQPPTLKNGEKK